jgi:hypothetical protein
MYRKNLQTGQRTLVLYLLDPERRLWRFYRVRTRTLLPDQQVVQAGATMQFLKNIGAMLLTVTGIVLVAQFQNWWAVLALLLLCMLALAMVE